MENCIFCMIAKGDIPSATLYEDEKFRVILDLGPAGRGHALVLPKEHYADLFEIPADLAAEALKLAKSLLPAMKKALDCDGFQLVQNNGAAAGQTVAHYHLHIIPCYADKGPGAVWTPGELSEEDKAAIPAAVQANL